MSSYLRQIRYAKLRKLPLKKKLRFLGHLRCLLAHLELKHHAKDEESPEPNYLDKEGKRLYAKINDECSRRGIRINNTFRNFLFKETELAHIEGLPRYVERLKEKEAQKIYRRKQKKGLLGK